MIKLQPSKEVLRQVIKDEQHRRTATYEYQGSVFQSDPASLTALQSRAAVMSPNDLAEWVTANNKSVQLTKVNLEFLSRSIAMRNDMVYSCAAALKRRVDAGEYVDAKDDDYWG